VAAEHHRDDAARQVLVDAEEALDLDLDPGLLQDLAANTGLEGLPQL